MQYSIGVATEQSFRYTVACFWSLVDIHKCSSGLLMAPSLLDKLTTSCNLLHDFWWIWPWSLLLCVVCGSEIGTNGYHLAVYSVDVAFAYHFMATCLIPALPPYRSTSGIDYASKKLSKMMGNSTSCPLNNWRIDRI